MHKYMLWEGFYHAFSKKASASVRGGSRMCKKGGPGGWYNPKIAQK